MGQSPSISDKRLTLPSYIFNNETDISCITERCIEQGHLKPGDNLLEVINKDVESLRALNLTPQDIWTNHTNLYILTNSNLLKDDDVSLKALDNVKLPEGFGKGWCKKLSLRKLLPKDHPYNYTDEDIYIRCLVWGGAERCPIEMSFSDEYHGYQRGDRDYFFIKGEEVLWVPDLLPAQGAMFGFYQTGEYRLDPIKYAEFFNIKEPLSLIKTRSEEVWCMQSCGSFIEPKGTLYQESDYDYWLDGNTLYTHTISKPGDKIIDGKNIHIVPGNLAEYKIGKSIH